MRANLFVGGVGCLPGLPLLCAARVAVVVWYGYIVHYGTLYVKTFCYCRYLYHTAILHDFMPLL